jgi:RNA polymerase sigma-70 factor (ECF subfamily)
MSISATTSREAFDRLLSGMRPKLHRYCARMTGSVIDGEDVVQEALVKAIEAYAVAPPTENPEGWIFRIVHNAALDFLRRRARQAAVSSDEDSDMIPDPDFSTEQRQIAAASLRTFMRLPVAQRGAVILMDVLGYSLEEISGILDASVAAVKASLHRGRERLRELASEPEDRLLPALPDPDRVRLGRYVERFNARDFDAIRDMLAEDVRLELVNRRRLTGSTEVGRYFHNYDQVKTWHFVPAMLEGRPAVLVRDVDETTSRMSEYFILLDWAGDRLVGIRDFRYARYVAEGADYVTLG